MFSWKKVGKVGKASAIGGGLLLLLGGAAALAGRKKEAEIQEEVEPAEESVQVDSDEYEEVTSSDTEEEFQE